MIYLSPILWQTQNEVLLHLRSLDVDKARLETDITSHWKFFMVLRKVQIK